MTLMRMGQYCTTHVCKKCPIKALAAQQHDSDRASTKWEIFRDDK